MLQKTTFLLKIHFFFCFVPVIYWLKKQMPLNIMKDQDDIFLVKDDIYLIQRLHQLSVLYNLFIKINFCFVLFVLLIDWRTKCRWTLWKTKTIFALYKDDIYLIQRQHRLSVLQYTLYLKYFLRWHMT